MDTFITSFPSTRNSAFVDSHTETNEDNGFQLYCHDNIVNDRDKYTHWSKFSDKETKMDRNRKSQMNELFSHDPTFLEGDIDNIEKDN